MILKKIYIWIVACIAIVGFTASDGKAQDLHYSQFYNSPQNINPALSGIYNGDKRYIASFRDQWRWVKVPWTTFGGAYDQKIYPSASDNHFFSVGGAFNHDRQGASLLNLTNLNLTGTYSHLLNKENILTGGLTLGFATRGFDTENLTWDAQWTGNEWDPNRPSGENFDSQRINYLESALGVNYRWQKSSRTKIDLGVSLFHLIEPSAGFYGQEDQTLPRHLNFSFISTFKLHRSIDIQLNGVHQLQRKYNETLVGGLLKLYLSHQRGKETQLHLGAGYRTSGSIIPTVAIEYSNLYVGASVDIDGTSFNKDLKSNRGALELHVRYIITDVKDLKAFKACPIY